MARKISRWLVLLVVLAAVVVGGWYGYSSVYLKEQEPAGDELRTATVRSGEIVISASGAGTVIPAAEAEIGFSGGGGVLVEHLVAVGDQVEAGDVLARVDDAQARKALISAQLQVVQAEDALVQQEDTSRAEQDLALAEANLELARMRLDELVNWEPDETAVAQAQTSLDAAEEDYDDVLNRSAYDQTTSARISLEQAQTGLDDAQEAYNTAWDPARDWELGDPRLASRLESERESVIRNLEKAQQNLEVAQANYNLAWANISESDELNAWNKVVSAQATLDSALTGPDGEEILSARIQVLQAEISLAQAQASLDEGVEEAELSLAQARINLEIAQADLAATELVAPMGGTVMAVNAAVGETVGSAPIITLADIAQPSVEVYLDETDLNNVAVGFETEVIFDALPDDLFAGSVVHVDPGLVTVSGVPMVRAIVQLDEASYAKPLLLPTGANALVDVVGLRTGSTLLVPVEALKEISPGKYGVFVLENDDPVFTQVEVGLMDYTYAEILSGLEQGDVVTTGVVETGG